MSIVIDTNVLVYAHRSDAAKHQAAEQRVRELATGDERFGLAWPCVSEFIRVVTHPRVFKTPTSITVAWRFVRDVLESPVVAVLAETDRHADVFERVLGESGASGNLIHDAHIVALALEHGFDEILTEDRDFHRFPRIRVVGLGPPGT